MSMGIYLPNMEMPKNCFDCPCYHHKIDDGYYDYEICRASGTVFNDGYSSVTGHKDHIDPFKARLDNCPLVPVPPHGRLIDADALKTKGTDIRDTWVDYDGIEDTVRGFSLDMLDHAPTIIPAEPCNNLSKPCKEEGD